MTVVIVLDAFSVSAVELLKSQEEHKNTLYSEVVPPFSFEPDASYLCGRYPEETDSGTHFWHLQEGSPFRRISHWAGIADRMPYLVQLILRRLANLQLKKKAETERLKRSISTARIPFRLLRYFNVVTKHYPFEERFSSFPTVFDLLRQKGKKWAYIGAPFSSSRAEDVLYQLRSNSLDGLDLVFLFVGDLDRIGHMHGPESQEYQCGVGKIERFVEEVKQFLRREVGEPRMLVFGDHGMVCIDRLVNIQESLKCLSVKPIRDYIYFLDSTLARFWFFSERARKEVTASMSHLTGGRLVSEEERKSYHIRYPHNRFGELIWWADGGTLIFPNFWQDRKPVEGMHGYQRGVMDNHAGFLLVDHDLRGSELLKEPLEMVDVFATMIDMLGLEMPEDAHGTSVYRRIT